MNAECLQQMHTHTAICFSDSQVHVCDDIVQLALIPYRNRSFFRPHYAGKAQIIGELVAWDEHMAQEQARGPHDHVARGQGRGSRGSGRAATAAGNTNNNSSTTSTTSTNTNTTTGSATVASGTVAMGVAAITRHKKLIDLARDGATGGR